MTHYCPKVYLNVLSGSSSFKIRCFLWLPLTITLALQVYEELKAHTSATEDSDILKRKLETQKTQDSLETGAVTITVQRIEKLQADEGKRIGEMESLQLDLVSKMDKVLTTVTELEAEASAAKLLNPVKERADEDIQDTMMRKVLEQVECRLTEVAMKHAALNGKVNAGSLDENEVSMQMKDTTSSAEDLRQELFAVMKVNDEVTLSLEELRGHVETWKGVSQKATEAFQSEIAQLKVQVKAHCQEASGLTFPEFKRTILC